MSKRQVILELRYSKHLATAALATSSSAEARIEMAALPKIAGAKVDATFAPTSMPGLRVRSPLATGYVSGAKFDLVTEPAESTYIIRAEIDEAKADEIRGLDAVVGCYADVQIQPCLICPSSPALGADSDVERLLCCSDMQNIKMDGNGVLVAIVDTGINIAYLAAHGKSPDFDPVRSWVPQPGLTPGNLPVNHGTMCAFDVCIAAPKCTLLDIALLQSNATGPNVMSGLLSDAVRAYAHLLSIMQAPVRPGEARSLVVNNSWGMFHPSWDFPVGDPGNYSDNPNHPFNRIVAALETAGADILFAAGNCGSNCADGRCQGVVSNAIYGANGHPSVLCVAGVDTKKQRVGYSSQGPGRLAHDKPDISGYTHFSGSGVYSADGGTSAATPVVAGVVAAVRSKRPYTAGNPSVSPAAIRALLRSTAEDLGTAGYDLDHGFGVVNGCELYKRFREPLIIDICQLYPPICRWRWIPVDLCRRYPHLCRDHLHLPPGLPPGPRPNRPGEYTFSTLDPDVVAQLGAVDMLTVLMALGEIGSNDLAPPQGILDAGTATGCRCGSSS